VATLLAQAWTQLGQAISANKLATAPEQSKVDTTEGQDAASEEHPPGTGAWWSE
jgi:hypothetical protein